MNKQQNYAGSISIPLKKIEVFSFSNLAVPFYHIVLNGEERVIGEIRMGSLKDEKMKDPIFQARNWNIFLASLINERTFGCNYQVAQAHSKVAEMDCDEEVLIDVYNDKQNGRQFIDLGASNILYVPYEDGTVGFRYAG